MTEIFEAQDRWWEIHEEHIATMLCRVYNHDVTPVEAIASMLEIARIDHRYFPEETDGEADSQDA